MIISAIHTRASLLTLALRFAIHTRASQFTLALTSSRVSVPH